MLGSGGRTGLGVWDQGGDDVNHITVTMPYEPLVSVNCNKYRGRYYVAEAAAWLDGLRMALNNALARQEPPMAPPVSVGIEILAPSGNLPDTENFRKPIVDVVAAALNCDDQQFTVWAEMSPPARRAEAGEDSAIIVRVREA